MARLPRTGYLIFTFGLLSLAARVYAAPTGRPTRMIHGAVDEAKLAVLTGNTRPEATALNDRGMVSDEFALNHMLLQLKRSPEREAAMKQFIDELHDATSPSFHQWLSADQFLEHYGVAQEDVDAVTSWLHQRGFTVHGVSGLTIDFSGTAGLVRSAFHTEIHNLVVNGVKHFANVSDPKIPAALEPVVAGVVSMHNFHPHPLLVPRGQYTFTNSNGTFHAMVPGDLATIYNFNPVYAAGVTGAGQSIMVLEDTYLFSTKDWDTFRETFGLTTRFPSGSLKQVSPKGALTCTNPGFQGLPVDPGYGDDAEAALDVEWSSAAAPNAAVILAACTDTSTTFGGLLALVNTINGPSSALPSVVSISYGEAEAFLGAAANFSYYATYAQAVTEGVSIFVSSGDEGSASADDGDVATHGIGVSGFTSTPFNVSVGGLDFGYTPDNVPSTVYWSPTNGTYFNSALSYIQEVPWNDSCAGGLAASFIGLAPVVLCNSPKVTRGALNFTLNAVAGSGGPSGCATGGAAFSGFVGGTCKGYAKPSWQSGMLGNPSDGVRDIPDVSLFASNGFWDAYYVACWSNPDPNVGGGFSCSGAPSTWSGWGGTSISSPIMAGIQALIDENTGDRWGNPNYVYYALAKVAYSSEGRVDYCNSTSVPKIGNTCAFYDITQGDNDGACTSGVYGFFTDCFHADAPIGVLSTSKSSSEPSFLTNVGWDFATGIGSVNTYNLLAYWPSTK
jgi:subtilase family serine protease